MIVSGMTPCERVRQERAPGRCNRHVHVATSEQRSVVETILERCVWSPQLAHAGNEIAGLGDLDLESHSEFMHTSRLCASGRQSPEPLSAVALQSPVRSRSRWRHGAGALGS